MLYLLGAMQNSPTDLQIAKQQLLKLTYMKSGSLEAELGNARQLSSLNKFLSTYL